MDLQRASLKALFYDYPIEHLVSILCNGKDELYAKPLPGLVQWRETAFTKSEVQGLFAGLFPQSDEPKGLERMIPGVFHLLNDYACQVLRYEQKNAWVDFKQLFRWRELSLYIGEDPLVLDFLATKDSFHEEKRSYFTWPDILPHNNHALNRLFEEGVSDVHAHLFASGNVVDLNWIGLMNHLDRFQSFKQSFESTQELPILQYQGDSLYKLSDLCVLAAFIRVKLFEFLQDEEEVRVGEMTKALRSLEDEFSLGELLQDTQSTISAYALDALPTRTSERLDYALPKQGYPVSELQSPFFLLAGERRLLYQYFLQLQSKKECWFAPYVYLYLLIKIRFRREFIQTNLLKGFQNFSDYQSRKGCFLGKKSDLHARLVPSFAIQSCLRSPKDDIEIRVSPDVLGKLAQMDFQSSFFDVNEKERLPKKIDVVVHFIKGKSKVPYQKQLDKVLKARDSLINSPFNWVGLDAAGSELNARPEVFGQVFRYAKRMGIERATFHAGEDFYDLADGLRTMDEAVFFLQLSQGDRLGHGLALGVDARTFYESRHSMVAIPEMVLLDNLVWIGQKAQQYNIMLEPSIRLFLQEKCFELYQHLYNREDFDSFHYWNSMLLRSNYPEQKAVSLSYWHEAAVCEHPRCKLAEKDSVAVELLQVYREWKAPSENVSCKFPSGYADLITQLQDKMQAALAEQQIAIECNPSSNLKIGRFHKYEEHPVFRFYPPGSKRADLPILNVSINTDDRGVFATSLVNEFSLIALAMTKQRLPDGNRKWSDEEIHAYVRTLVRNGKEQRFSQNMEKTSVPYLHCNGLFIPEDSLGIVCQATQNNK